MQVRIFQSADMASGLRMIKQELGPDALILSTKTIRNGKLGLLSKPMLEITAAIDSDFPQKQQKQKSVEFTLAPAPKPTKSTRPTKSQRQSRSFAHVIDEPVEQYLDNVTPPRTS